MSRRPAALAGYAVLAVAVLYAPIALSSMWFAFDPDAPRIQEQLDRMVGGAAYATGPGSVHAARTEDYAEHRLLMLTHTVGGGVALLVACAQWTARRRLTRGSHRHIGRVYFAVMTVSMAAAMAFLVVSADVEGTGQVAFRWQLWVLAISTLGSAAAAVVHARRGDPIGHHRWMCLHFAFMMTAPVLRLCWTVLGPLLPDYDMLTNLKAGAVALAVIAPASAVVAVALSERPHSRGDTPRPAHLWLALAVLGCCAIVVVAPDEVARTAGYPWFHVAPVLAATVLAVAARGVARRSGRTASVWDDLLLATSLAPWAAVAAGWIASFSVGPLEGYLAGLMVGPGIPIVMTLAAARAPRTGSRGERGDHPGGLPGRELLDALLEARRLEQLGEATQPARDHGLGLGEQRLHR